MQIPLDYLEEIKGLSEKITDLRLELTELASKLRFLSEQEQTANVKLWNAVYRIFPELEDEICRVGERGTEVIVYETDDEEDGNDFDKFAKKIMDTIKKRSEEDHKN